jgi:DNA helicase II / ATP-dependent DNA helicase PcrA
LPNNLVIIAAAGSRKTSHLVEEALAAPSRRTLITTYTRDGVAEIESKFTKACGCVPPHVTVMSWYEFLLQEGARPYQLALTRDRRVRSIDFYTRTPRFVKRGAPKLRYYFNSGGDLYVNRVAEFVLSVNQRTNGAVLRRLAGLFDHIMVDEMQDLSGYDFNLLDELFAAETAFTCVGDPRQAIFSTTTALKNAKYKAKNIIEWLNEPGRKEDLAIERRNECYRCNQAICDYADALYPTMERTVSKNDLTTGHYGVHFLRRTEVESYVQRIRPQVLRYDKKANSEGHIAMNFGVSKGHSFPNVLIFPTAKYRRFMRTGDLKDAGSIAKMYVAITRAERSVAIVKD